jgi:hypothetical protein
MTKIKGDVPDRTEKQTKKESSVDVVSFLFSHTFFIVCDDVAGVMMLAWPR